MHKLLIAAAASVLAAACAWGQAEVPPQPKSSVDCRACHTTESPTKEKPSLVKCPRQRTKGVHSPSDGPATLTLGSSGDKYGPVKFSHRVHAEMAEMGGGCYSCHHYDQGGRIQRCGECHEAKRAREDLGKPDLQGALHRLCVDCHRKSGGDAACAACHGNAHPAKTRLPSRVVYRTPTAPGKLVSFLHADHAKRFGLKCAQCHQQQSCGGCHDPASRIGGAPPRTLKTDDAVAAAHQGCVKCHQGDVAGGCQSCHSDKALTAFDHGRTTGWVQNRFHAKLECRACHGDKGKFAKVDGSCDACHKGWENKFDHVKTGLALDETHAGLECASCHDKTYAAKPECSSCHDRSYPKDKPGRLLKAAAAPHEK